MATGIDVEDFKFLSCILWKKLKFWEVLRKIIPSPLTHQAPASRYNYLASSY